MTAPRRHNAIVLAASRGAGDPMATAFAARHKCLIEVAGEAMIARVVEALSAAPEIGDLYISIERPELLREAPAFRRFRDRSSIRLVTSGENPAASVERAIGEGVRFPCLVTTADHALLTPDMIGHFLRRSEACGASVTAALAPSELIERFCPAGARTYLRFAGGRYSGCNLYWLGDEAALAAVRLWARADRERKVPWRLMRAFGPGALFAYLTGRLSLEAAMARASRVLGVEAQAVVMPFGEAAIDVDKPADLALAETILAQRAGS